MEPNYQFLYILLFLLIVVSGLLFLLFLHLFYRHKQKELQKRIDISENGLRPYDFFKLRQKTQGDVVGVYVLYNESKDKYYVGQAKRLYFRVNQHFTGHGNGDVYADYKYGDAFRIKLIKLTESGCDDLDELERRMIARYQAYDKGYNKTRGNHSW